MPMLFINPGFIPRNPYPFLFPNRDFNCCLNILLLFLCLLFIMNLFFLSDILVILKIIKLLFFSKIKFKFSELNKLLFNF